jgi:hypothetical protein
MENNTWDLKLKSPKAFVIKSDPSTLPLKIFAPAFLTLLFSFIFFNE